MESTGHKSRSGEPMREQSAQVTETASPERDAVRSSTASVARLNSEPDTVEITAGHAGDHRLVHELLRIVHQAPPYEEFLSWLDEPSYEPLDRLLVKQAGQVVAHVQLLDRAAWFGGVRVSVGGVQDLVSLPEYREAGYSQRLLAAAEKTLGERAALIAVARSEQPGPFLAAGWSEVADQRATEASVGDILAHLTSIDTTPRRRALKIRLWRQVELDALRHVYCHAAENSWGALDRSESYWRWLVGQKAYDEVIVAVHGRDRWDELDRPSRIVGYVVTRGSHVVESCCLTKFSHAGPRLLARACQDAIERDHRGLSLHLPASDPLHEQMIAAGGHWCDKGRTPGGTLLVKLLDPAKWVEAIYPRLVARAKAAAIPRPYHVAFRAGSQTSRLELTRRSGHFAVGVDDPPQVECAPETLGALLLGNLDVHSARDAGLLQISDDTTAERLALLFPRQSFCPPPFDLLRF